MLYKRSVSVEKYILLFNKVKFQCFLQIKSQNTDKFTDFLNIDGDITLGNNGPSSNPSLNLTSSK